MVWSSIAIEKLLRAIKHSRVLRDPFREWHYAKIGCAVKRFEKDASITRERLAAKLLLLQPFVRFPIHVSNVRFSTEIDLSASFSLFLSLPFLFLFFSSEWAALRCKCPVISRRSIKTRSNAKKFKVQYFEKGKEREREREREKMCVYWQTLSCHRALIYAINILISRNISIE